MTTRPIEHINVALSAGAVATAALLASPHFALSVAAGAALESLNFRGLSVASRAFFAGAVRGNTAWLLLLALRLGLVAVVLFAALRAGADPVGVLVGLSMILPASLIGAWRMRPRVDPAAPALSPEPERGEDDWGWDARLYADPPATTDSRGPSGAAMGRDQSERV